MALWLQNILLLPLFTAPNFLLMHLDFNVLTSLAEEELILPTLEEGAGTATPLVLFSSGFDTTVLSEAPPEESGEGAESHYQPSPQKACVATCIAPEITSPS